MANQGGGGEFLPHGVNSQNNHSFHPPPSLCSNHEATLTILDIERFLFTDHDSNNNTSEDGEMPFSDFPSDQHPPIDSNNFYSEDEVIGLNDLGPHDGLNGNCEGVNDPLISESANPNLKNHLSLDGDQNKEINESAQQRLMNVASNRLKRHWSTEEDRKLLSLVSKHGAGKWVRIARDMEGRDSKQCYARWKYYLSPDIKKKDKWSEEEEKVFIEAHQILGNKWAEIAKRIPGRSGNSIKNHWYTTQRKLEKMENSEATKLQDYINHKILKETDIKHSNNSTTSTPTPCTHSTSNESCINIGGLQM